MKVALAQLNYHIGNFAANLDKILQNIERAKSEGADLVVFAELAVCGYPPRDFLQFDDFIMECEIAIDKIAAACVDIAAIVGAPSINYQEQGKDLHNSAFFLAEGRIVSIHHKALLPTYDVFDEYRYFEPSAQCQIINYKGKKIALTICEDIWDVEEELMYTIHPMDELNWHRPDVMINIAASPFKFDHPQARREVLARNVSQYKVPIVYLNHVGAQTELIFDGGSMVMNKKGEVVSQLASFEEDFKLIDLNGIEAQEDLPLNNEKIAMIHDALVLGVRDYFAKLGFKKAILGLSGGVDSAITLAIATEALGAENVMAVMMPSQYSSDHSISDSEQLVANLGCMIDTIPIADIYARYEGALSSQFNGLEFDVTEENLQARIRGVLLMAISNKHGYILLNTSNKSESAVGYGTLYGDMCGGLSVLGDLYKTEVFDLARYMNRDAEVVPTNIITKPPSAELRPDQKDSDSLPDYETLDSILYRYIEEQRSPGQIIAEGYDAALVNRILKLVNINEYKRFQMAPTLRVSKKAFGMGRRMPIVAKYLS
jgi:NAD+ synthase (glutamine-hydrolysing)